jgi:patatin-related protein
MTDNVKATKELRLGVVCYGGVSLAIYMHGMTKELGKLVAASAKFEEGGENPFKPSQVEYVYWQALEKLPLRTRVVIDVISGTSAGGINGIFLAKSLSEGQSQDALRDIWLDKGEFKKIMGGSQFWTNQAKLIWWVLGEIVCPIVVWLIAFVPDRLAGLFGKGFLGRINRSVSGWLYNLVKDRPRPPLSGNIMFGWLLDGLRAMDKAKLEFIRDNTLMPENHSLELFVTTTDFYGCSRRVLISRPANLSDKTHRHVLKFSNESKKGDQFVSKYNNALAFAARATSSFPGAFPPININDIEINAGKWAEQDEILSGLFRIYELSDSELPGEDSYKQHHFVDGGVLDNYPLGHAIKAIIRKPAAFEVDRKLVFIDPDPKDTGMEGGNKNEKAPGLLATVLGSIVSIRSHEPILDDILDVNKFNERVQTVNNIISASENDVNSILQSLGSFPDKDDPGQITVMRDRINTEARKLSGYAYATYTRMKLQSVVDQISSIVLEVCRFPDESNHAFFVREMLQKWAVENDILKSGTGLTTLQIDLLKTFDLDFSERRIRFVIHYINKNLYPHAGEPGYPGRDQLNQAKGALYETITKMRDRVYIEKGGLFTFIDSELFQVERISQYFKKDQTGAGDKEWLDGIDVLKDRLKAFYDANMLDFGAELYKNFQDITAGWDPDIRKRLLLFYFGFPFWDVLIFPVRYLSDVGELDKIEIMRMSPLESDRLTPPENGKKLEGTAFAHFGAFFDRKFRENDYLWGRLDGAEQLLGLLLDGSGDEAGFCNQAFEAILKEEEGSLPKIRPLIEHLKNQIKAGSKK